ncbi:FAD-dependent thymidylate synthase [Thermosynechococcaceae cyanobacterium BACA0444]|uniref:FAD-dependent thymidylate synthase n=1 Tax=Pseudocalidococcus azoricus BACA0444 TaxID=2918990 RepID=A0AAE4JYY1_9CYAN|nr:FAD-dependent thymidylate synthase [Pseudocalidococcus azoricus]MDS3860247.1 FAD-dependent thymidylate synthase [Pseudocalidococcus azoricus BACA0444]
MEVKLVSITQPVVEVAGETLSAEGLMAYCARVSSPNQDNPNYAKLLAYCIRHGHWSVFEMVDMTVEIVTTRMIAQQILRHRSFSFQEFSLRYAPAQGFETYPARRQDVKNRQNSIDDLAESDQAWFRDSQQQVWDMNSGLYQEALERGIAKECARALLPLNTVTRIYMKGSVRSWIHYFQVRCTPDCQQEHREIACGIREIFQAQFPTVATALT